MDFMKRPSRRQFLASLAAAGTALAWPGLSRVALADLPDRFHRDGQLVVLPSKGTLYVANDFHTRHLDFQKWLKKTDLEARLRQDENAYGLVLGDVLDVKPGDVEAEAGGDLRILDKVREIQSKPGGERLIFILGNHEQEQMKLYDALKKQFGFPANRQRLVAALYNSIDGAYFRQWNFIERVTEEYIQYLKTLPAAVIGKNGLVGVHAGPVKKAMGPRDLAGIKEEMTVDLLWSRPAKEYDRQDKTLHLYDTADVTGFLKAMDGAGLMIVGHTPLPALPEGMVKEGLGVLGEQCIVMGASFGSMPGKKQHLVFDLAKKYSRFGDLGLGKEIQPVEG